MKLIGLAPISFILIVIK